MATLRVRYEGRDILTTKKIAEERLFICTGCDFYTMNGKCQDCGCMMRLKVGLTSAKCPQDKWDM